jgi:hypothetical protein
MTTSMRTIAITGGIVLAALTACSEKKGPAPAPPSTVTSTARERGEMRQTATTTAQAKVVAVDQKDRNVTLQGSDGHEFTIHVGDEVRNLPQVHKGDMVNIVYHEAIAAKLVKKGKGKPGIEAAEGAERAPLGAMPAAAGARTVQVTATVTRIDKENQTVTLKGPRGKSVDVKVQNPENMELVKKGDLVEITYTEAVAISVDKVK